MLHDHVHVAVVVQIVELLWDSHGRTSGDVGGNSGDILIFLEAILMIFRYLLWKFDMLLFGGDSGDFLYIFEAVFIYFGGNFVKILIRCEKFLYGLIYLIMLLYSRITILIIV